MSHSTYKFYPMKRHFQNLIFILFLFLSRSVMAQWININAPTLAVGNSIYFASADTGYMVTADFNNGGGIWKTTNGSGWTSQLTTTDYLFDVHFISNEVGWAAGGVIGGGVIMKTTDGGSTWNVQTDSCEQIMSIFFVNNTMGWAVANDASQGTYFIYHTSDGGAHWTTQQTGGDYVRAVFFISETTGWVAGDNGRIYGTINGGVTWNLLTNGIVCHFNDIQFINDTVGWAVGSYVDGKCFKTIDGGATWLPQALPTIDPITSVHFISNNIGWICGSNGMVSITNDGGDTWQQELSGTTNHLNSIHILNANVGYATGVNGTVIKYSNPVELKNTKENSGLLVYPNPGKGIFEIKFNENTSAEKFIEAEFYAIDGAYLSTHFLNATMQSRTIDLSNYPNGSYVMKLKTENEVSLHRIIINKE